MTAHQSDPGRPESREVFWERTFSEGIWDYLDAIEETARYGIVAGYIHRLAKGGCVLDAGCGQGLLAAYLDLDRVRYDGFDVSPTAIRRARELHGGIDYFSCSLDDFSCPPESYDMVVFNEVLSTLENSIATLKRYYGYVRPGGYVLISQFQNADPTSNAHASTLRLEAAFASERYPVIATSEAKECFTGKSWRIYCLQKPRRPDSARIPRAAELMPADGRGWDALVAELDCWSADDGEATFWWRDDDAVEDTPALRRLLQSAGTIPLGLAVVPSRVRPSLAECLARNPTVDVLQHGWAHVNHGPDGNDEYPGSRPRADVVRELIQGRAILDALFGSQALAVFVPPWHGFDDGFLPLLPGAGLTGFSRKGPRRSEFAAPGVFQANAHVSPIRWADPPSFGNEETYLEAIVEHLRGRRLGRYDRAEATGLLTHHLVQNDASYAFIERFAAVVGDHPRATWVAARDIFPR